MRKSAKLKLYSLYLDCYIMCKIDWGSSENFGTYSKASIYAKRDFLYANEPFFGFQKMLSWPYVDFNFEF